MKPSSEEIFKWAREVYGEDPGKPWHASAFKHIEALCDLAYAAGAAAMQERCAEEADKWQSAIHDPRYECDCAAAIRALGDDCATDKAEHKWVCPKCKVDRLKEDCKGDRMRCPMVGEAYGAIRALGGDDE